MKTKSDFFKDMIKGFVIVSIFILTIQYPFLVFNPLVQGAMIAIAIFIAAKPPFWLLKISRIMIIVAAIIVAFKNPIAALSFVGLLLPLNENLIVGLQMFHNWFAMYRDPHAYINYNILQHNVNKESDVISAEDKTDYSQDLRYQDDLDRLTIPYNVGKLHPAFNIILIVSILMTVVYDFYLIFSTLDVGLIYLILFISLCLIIPFSIIIYFQNQTSLFSDREIFDRFWGININTILYKDIRGIEAYGFDYGNGVVSMLVRIIYLTKTQKYKVLIPAFPPNIPAFNAKLISLIKIVKKVSPQLQINGFAEEIINNNRDLLEADRLIDLNPKDADAHNNRGVLKQTNLHDIQGALADYNKAILLGRGSANELNPQYANPYYNRGLIKGYNLNDIPGALADYNQAIEINPQYANTYYNRGLLKKDNLNDKTGAIEDFQKAANLYHEQDDMPSYQNAIDRLKELGVSN
jgi:tetratricopeptide (TPR) repeat protein